MRRAARDDARRDEIFFARTREFLLQNFQECVQ